MSRGSLLVALACLCLTAQERGKTGAGLPLRPARTIEFTTDEGTWLSVDVSPDGKRLVFDMLGDIYDLPIEGGDARRLLGGMAFESQPKYSPDGKHITFLSDRDGAENVWIANADGGDPKQLSFEDQGTACSPVWSPDGKSVIATRGGRPAPFVLWNYPVESGRPARIATGKETADSTPGMHSAFGAAIAPDGKHIYYAYHAGTLAGGNIGSPQWQISRFNRATGIDEVITHEQGGAFRPVLSPDGNWLVYAERYDTKTGLRIRNLTTDEDRWLKYPIQRDDQEQMLYPSMDLLPGYAFMPDGKSIVAAYGGKIRRIEVATGRERIIPFQAKVSQELGPLLNFPERVDQGPVRARLIQTPSESPDGKRLVFSALAHLYVQDIPNNTPRRITTGDTPEFQPIWSPDGQWIAYVTWTLEGGNIWKARADGQGTPQRLTPISAYYRDPAWSPDGSRIVALKSPIRGQLMSQRNIPYGQPSPNQHLVWIPAEGGEIQDIEAARGFRHPQFTTDNQHFYVHSGRELVVMGFKGEKRRPVLNVTGSGAGGREINVAADIRVSPDAKWALVVFATMYSEAYLVRIPAEGQPIKVNVTSPTVPVQKVAKTGADYLGWADRGATMTWASGDTYFRQPLSSVKFDAGAEDGAIQRIVARVEAPRRGGRGVIVLRGAQVVTMRGDEILQGADIVVEDDRIKQVGPTGTVRIPANAKVWDVRGKTIVPGFIDTHDHWFDMQRDVLELQHWDFLATLAYGVTSGRDPQTETNDSFAYQDLADTGQILGPRGYSAGQGIFWMANIRTPERALDIVRKYRDSYRTKTIKSYLIGNRTQRQLIVQASQNAGLMPTAEGQSDLKMDLTHIIDGFSGNEHLLPANPMYKDIVEFVARSGVFYTPTLIVTANGPSTENYYFTRTEVHDDPKVRRFIPHYMVDAKTLHRSWARDSEYNFVQTATATAKIMRAGGRVCVGSHGQMQGIAFHWEMWALASGGMTGLEVLRAATRNGADAIGYGADLGSIETGKLADLVILEKDPLVNIRNTNTIAYVMRGGEMFEGATLNEVWPLEKRLPKLWWWDDVPNP